MHTSLTTSGKEASQDGKYLYTPQAEDRLKERGFYDTMASYGELLPRGLNESIQTLLKDASLFVGVQASQQLSTMDPVKSEAGALTELGILVVSIVAMATSRFDLDNFFAKHIARFKKGWEDRPLSDWRLLLTKLLTSLLVFLGLAVGPVLSLFAQENAYTDNPDGGHNDVAWLSANAGSGKGPYTVMGLVVLNLEAERSSPADRLLRLNVALALISSCWIIAASFWRHHEALIANKQAQAPSSSTEMHPQGAVRGGAEAVEGSKPSARDLELGDRYHGQALGPKSSSSLKTSEELLSNSRDGVASEDGNKRGVNPLLLSGSLRVRHVK